MVGESYLDFLKCNELWKVCKWNCNRDVEQTELLRSNSKLGSLIILSDAVYTKR